MKRYKVIETITQTHFSLVQKIEDQKTGKIYLKKTLLDRSDPILYHQFLQEIEILSSLQGSYFPQLIDILDEEGQLSLIEQWIDGIPLQEWLKTNPSKRQRKKILLDLLDHLRSFHDQNYLYIDWKEEHLFIDHDQVYLVDFNGCVPKNASRLLVASSSQSLPKTSCYGEKEDLQIAGKILQKIYKHKPKTTIALIQKQLRKPRIKRRWILYCLFSVCLLIHSFSSRTLIERYLNQGRPLYRWIETNQIETNGLNEQERHFFIREAIQSKDPSICAYFLDHFAEKETDETLWLLLKWSALDYSNLTAENIDRLLSMNIQKEHEELFVDVCIQNDILLDRSQQQKLFDQLGKDLEGKKAIVRYWIYLLQGQNDTIELPQAWFETKEEDQEWEELKECWNNMEKEKEKIWNKQ